MELCIVHDCIHVSSIRIVATRLWDLIFMMMVILLYWVPAYIPWILDFKAILFIQMDAPMLWIFSHSPFYLDGCVHTVDSCFDFRYVYVYASFICRCPDNVYSHPCKIS